MSGQKQPGSLPKKHFLAELEEQTIEFWKTQNIFKKSLEARKQDKHFEFYDGPPFANGLPHYGHLVSSILKDAIPRYKTMQGYYVPRRFGWDCHGLPAEMKAEQDLDLGSKADIEQYGVEKFIDYCRASVTQFTKEWESYIDRIGRWVDFKDNYYTMDADYMESVIWAFKQMYDRGLVVEGYKVMPYCSVCETALSYFESRLDDSYRERQDLAVTVRFPLESGETALAWTTTPWTLPANLALAVNKDLSYDVWEGNGERLLIGDKTAERYAAELTGYKKIGTKPGSELVGLSYEPPFNYFAGHKNSHIILHADFVTEEDGTGIAHEAPGFGEEDQVVCEAAGIKVVVPVDKQGNYTDEITDFVGVNVFDANEHVINHLQTQKRLFKQEVYTHSYPHCWRTDNPLIFRAVSSWMIKVPEFKAELQKNNQQINWIPESVRDGAFGQWLEGVRNWNVSRDRYWGTPIPVWKTDDGEVLVVGSLEEIQKRAVGEHKITDLHKPGIDKVVLKTDSGKEAHRVSEVFDCWFESGSMPFAQHNYPFKNKDFKHPADFIVEYIGQVRGWFYTLHVLSTALFDGPAFKNVITHGVILGSDNRKMSKKLGNYPDLNHVFTTYGADALRLYLCTSPVINGETVAIDEKAILDIQRNVLLTLWNTLSFFKMYANIDGWKPPKEFVEPKSDEILDKWILARLDEVIKEVTDGADAYQVPKATRPLQPFIDDLSNWFVRRSRRRFWKSEDDGDKTKAYQTLHYVLVRLAQLMAPWTPFISEKLWQELTQGTNLPESVHMSDWPISNKPNKASTKLLEDMRLIREAVIAEGLGQRAAAGIKVRQPLASATVSVEVDNQEEFSHMITEELNVKAVKWAKTGKAIDLDIKLTSDLLAEGLMREIVRRVQNARKNAGLNVEDRIKLALRTESIDIKAALDKFSDAIFTETLATGELTGEASHSEVVKVDGKELTISLRKA